MTGEKPIIYSAIKILFIIAFVIMLMIGFFLYVTGYQPVTTLNGVYSTISLNMPKDTQELIQKAGTGELFSEFEAVYNQDYPLRPFSIKMNNTIDFLQGKSSNTGICIGKNHELYEYNYLWDYGMTDRAWNGIANRESLRVITEKLSYIQEEFKKHGKHVYVLITPNKADFTAEHIPDYIQSVSKSKNEDTSRNIDVLKILFDEYGISYFDSTEYIRNSLPAEVIPFYRSGIHYSWPAGYHVAKELFSRIEEETGMKMPHFDLKVQEQEDVVFPNRDLFDLLNTFPEIGSGIYNDQPQQQVYIENPEASAVSTVFQGGSFLGPFIDMNNRYPGIFRKIDIIQNTVFMPQGEAMVNLNTIRDVDLDKVINDELFIFEVNETSAASMSFGFIDYLSDYLGTTDLVKLKPYALIFGEPATIQPAQPYGIYDLNAEGIPWRFTAQSFGCKLENPDIFSKGLVISTIITDDLKTVSNNEAIVMEVKINGIKTGEYPLDQTGTVYISPEELSAAADPDGICMIDCSVNKGFIPNELHPENPDKRMLAVILYSITAAEERVIK